MSKFTSLWTIVFFLVSLFFLQPFLQSLELDLAYQREDFTNALWQTLSHSLIHLNYTHLALNASALLCIYLLFTPAFETPLWIVALLLSAITSTVGMYLFSPEVAWCVGLSGALHGLFIYAVFRSSAHWLWVIAFTTKIIVEQLPAFQTNAEVQLTSQLIGGDVVVDAHLWGAVGGLLLITLRAATKISTYIEIARR